MKLVWLRRDLRAVDNTALSHALASGEAVWALYIATPGQWLRHDMAPIQADLIYRRLTALKRELAELNVPLLYLEVEDYAQAALAVVTLADKLGVSAVLANRDYEWNERLRDSLAADQFQTHGIEWSTFDDKCLLAPGTILNKQGQYFKVFTPFKRAWLARFIPPVVAPVRAAPAWKISAEAQPFVWSEAQSFTYPRAASEQWPVDFDTIRARLRSFCRQQIDDYQNNRDFPALAATSSLSPYLATGILSPRQCLARVYAESKAGALSPGAQAWLNELIWREFYQHLLLLEPKISKQKDFHDWGARLDWWQDDQAFSLWCQGKTGFPLVDAAMRQLNQTGWMHNRLRMLVASFLTKDLHIDWRWGERYFMQHLVDGDYAANNGGWQWSASTGCDAQPYFRIFNPQSQAIKFDPRGEFIRQWLPELSAVPDAYIHSPWQWPAVKDLSYPQPMVDHKVERAVTLQMYRQAKDKADHVT